MKHSFSESVFSYRRTYITEPPVTSFFRGTAVLAKLSAEALCCSRRATTSQMS